MSDENPDEPKFTVYDDNGMPHVVTLSEALERQQMLRDKKEAQWRDTNHEFWTQMASMLDKATDDEVVNFVAFLRAIVRSKGKGLANFYLGWIVSRLEQTRNICSSCGVNHEKDMDDALKELRDAFQPEQLDLVTSEGQVNADMVAEPVKLDDDPQDMVTYGVAYVHEVVADEPIDARVICVRCWDERTGIGFYWPNLEDRMRRDPDVSGCPRCIDKAKNG